MGLDYVPKARCGFGRGEWSCYFVPGMVVRGMTLSVCYELTISIDKEVMQETSVGVGRGVRRSSLVTWVRGTIDNDKPEKVVVVVIVVKATCRLARLLGSTWFSPHHNMSGVLYFPGQAEMDPLIANPNKRILYF